MNRTERDRPAAPTRHRHERNSWMLAGGAVEWCYQCGAWRSLKPVNGRSNVLMAATKWQRPSGIGGPNPALKETT